MGNNMDDSKIWQVMVAVFGFILTSIGYVWRRIDNKIEKNSEDISAHNCNLAVISKRLDHQDEKLKEISDTNKEIITILSNKAKKPTKD
jgi:hypothetical protein